MVEKTKIQVENVSVWFAATRVLKSINIKVWENEILGVIGPANSGKSTFLRCLNRFNDLTPSFKMEGKVFIDETDIYHTPIDVDW